MKYLFLFTISPVQAFIAQARKAQDLYAGSQLLSDLVRCAIEVLFEQKQNAEIRFPAKWMNETAALPNRFLAEIECNENEASKIGKIVQDAVQAKFKDIADRIFQEYCKGQAKPENFDFQIANHLTINWIFENLESKTYLDAFQNIESNLGAIKNMRQFNQLPKSEKGRKDSLTGELNALFFNKNGKPNAFTENAIEIKVLSNYLSKGEGLSAVSFMKRFYKDFSFPSTAKIAQLDILDEIEKQREFIVFKNIFQNNFDYQLLYKENLTEEYLKKHDLQVNHGGLQFVTDCFNKIQFQKDNKQKKYYAVLVFDGDDMGKWLSGEPLKDVKNDDTILKKYHFTVSELLAGFAEKAKNYVDNEKIGRTIYAGGDDFLALLNLDNIFETLILLRKLFDDEVNLKLKGEFSQINKGEPLTFSAGVTIAHYKEPLGEVLNRARGLEQKAKLINDKNAVAISVMKHSGEMQEMVIKWGDSINITRNIDNISEILELIKKKDFSPAYIANMNKVFEIFKEKQKNGIDNFKEIFRTETSRLVKRSCLQKENKMVGIKDLTENIFNIYDSSVIDETGLTNLLEVLNIIDFIYRKA